jgi:hypothetical protein
MFAGSAAENRMMGASAASQMEAKTVIDRVRLLMRFLNMNTDLRIKPDV